VSETTVKPSDFPQHKKFPRNFVQIGDLEAFHVNRIMLH